MKEIITLTALIILVAIIGVIAWILYQGISNYFCKKYWEENIRENDIWYITLRKHNPYMYNYVKVIELKRDVTGKLWVRYKYGDGSISNDRFDTFYRFHKFVKNESEEEFYKQDK